MEWVGMGWIDGWMDGKDEKDGKEFTCRKHVKSLSLFFLSF